MLKRIKKHTNAVDRIFYDAIKIKKNIRARTYRKKQIQGVFYMRKIASLLFIFTLTAFAFQAWAVEKKQLNEAQVKLGVFTVIESLAKIDGYDLKGMTPDSIIIDRKIPIKRGSMTFFAIKVIIPKIADSKAKLPSNIALITDSSGTLQFDNVRNLATGKSVTAKSLGMLEPPAAPKKDKKNIEQKPVRIPSDLGTTFFHGTGKHEVILISDPFCPFCGKAYLHLMRNKSRLKKISLAHFPLLSHPGATLTAWAIKHAEKKGLGPQLIDFAYTSLKPSREEMGKGLQEVRMAITTKIINRFPAISDGMDPAAFYNHLKKTYSSELKKEKDYLLKLGVNSVPFIVIDGQLLRGFKPSDMDDLLE